MANEELYEELLFKKNLALSTQYKEIRKRILDYMVENSKYTEQDSARFKWWLFMLHEVDSWVDECDRYLEKAKKEKGE